MKLAVIGTGYVGLLTGRCLAESDNDVVCVDSDQPTIEALRLGKLPIHEPGLCELLKRSAQVDRLRFTSDLCEAVRESEIILIAIGTPQLRGGSAGLFDVSAVASTIGDAMKTLEAVHAVNEIHKGAIQQKTHGHIQRPLATVVEVPEPQSACCLAPNSMW